MDWDGPILDNHLHLNDETGAGLEAVGEFADAGGTHMLVVNQPSWSYASDGDAPPTIDVGFRRTIELCKRASALLPGQAWPVLGVHPALISRLTDDHGYNVAEAIEHMSAGLDRAADYVDRGDALAIKSGRPHYDVSPAIWDASNEVLRYAIERAADVDCAVQLHTEAGSAFGEIATWADEAGLPRHRVVKHYASGPIQGPLPSVIARKEAIRAIVEAEGPFLLETDFLDDPDRPGAVLGPKTVPRRTRWLAQEHGSAPLERAHVETPKLVYEIDTETTLAE